MGGESRNAKTNKVIDMFVAKNAGVTVDRQSADFAKYFDKLNVQAASKNLPCVVQLQGRQINDYTKRNVLLPLDPMVDSGAIDVSDIPKSVVDAGRGTDGKLYFLPYGAAYDAVGINTTLAEKAGAGTLPENYDWPTFTKYLTKAQAGMPEGTNAANNGGGRPNYFIAWTQANGKTLFNDEGKLGFSKEDLAQYWTMWDDLRKAGVVVSPQKAAEEPTAPDQSYLAHGEVMSDTLPGNALTPATKTLSGAAPGNTLTTLPYPPARAGPATHCTHRVSRCPRTATISRPQQRSSTSSPTTLRQGSSSARITAQPPTPRSWTRNWPTRLSPARRSTSWNSTKKSSQTNRRPSSFLPATSPSSRTPSNEPMRRWPSNG